MKVIYPEKVSSVTANVEVSTYEASNLLDNHPKKAWKSNTDTGTVTATVNGGANAVGVFGISGISLALTVKDTIGNILESRTLYNLKGINTYFSFFTDEFTSFDSFWIDYTYQTDEHNLVFEFENTSGSSVVAGVISAGIARTFYEPDFSLEESLKDYSIVKELNNGAFYIRKRDVVKTFSGQIEVLRDSDFYGFMQDVVEKEGSKPLAWRITDYDNNNWSVFARMQKMPVGGHDQVRYSTISFNLIEVI